MAWPDKVDVFRPVLARVEGTYKPATNSQGGLANEIVVDKLTALERLKMPAEPKKPKKKFNRLDSSWWSHIVRDPSVYAGTNVITYAVVMQQDANTGGDAFLAAASSSPIWDAGAGDLTIYSGKYVTVEPGERLRIKGTVLGPETYSNKAGGSNTVPSLKIDSVRRLN